VLCGVAGISVLLPMSPPPQEETAGPDERQATIDAALDGPKLTLHRLLGVQAFLAEDQGVEYTDAGSVVARRGGESVAPVASSAPWMVRERPRDKKRRSNDLLSLLDGGEEADAEDAFAEAFGTTLDVELPVREEGWGWLVDEVVGSPEPSRVDRALSGDVLLRDNYRSSTRGDPLNTQLPTPDDVLSYDGGLGVTPRGR